MARINNLSNFLTDVAAAIKTKLDDQTSIPAEDFDTKILSIETVGNYQDKSINISSNGNYTLLPDQNYDAISSVQITVATPIINNQNKTINPTTNQQVISADQGYSGLGDVTINAVDNTIDNNITAREY